MLRDQPGFLSATSVTLRRTTSFFHSCTSKRHISNNVVSERRGGGVHMLARRTTWKGFGPKSSDDESPEPPPPPSADVQADLEKAAQEYGIDTSRKLKKEEQEPQPKTFYGRVEKSVGKDVLNYFEGGLVFGGLGSLVYMLGVGIAVGALAYSKASGTAAPEGLVAFCDANQAGLTKALVAFLVCSVTYGAYKYSELQAGTENKI